MKNNRFTTIITNVWNFRYDGKDYKETFSDVESAAKWDGIIVINRKSPGQYGDKQVESNITTYLNVNELDILWYEENIMTEIKPKPLKSKKK